MKLTKNYIWDYEVDKLDLRNPDVLIWYLQRKLEYGDWQALDRKTLKKYLPKLRINVFLKQILKNFLEKYA